MHFWSFDRYSGHVAILLAIIKIFKKMIILKNIIISCPMHALGVNIHYSIFSVLSILSNCKHTFENMVIMLNLCNIDIIIKL